MFACIIYMYTVKVHKLYTTMCLIHINDLLWIHISTTFSWNILDIVQLFIHYSKYNIRTTWTNVTVRHPLMDNTYSNELQGVLRTQKSFIWISLYKCYVHINTYKQFKNFNWSQTRYYPTGHYRVDFAFTLS
jgi:hypothetical protein